MQQATSKCLLNVREGAFNSAVGAGLGGVQGPSGSNGQWGRHCFWVWVTQPDANAWGQGRIDHIRCVPGLRLLHRPKELPQAEPQHRRPGSEAPAVLLTLCHGGPEEQFPLQALGGVPSPEEEPRPGALGAVVEAAQLRHLQEDLLLLAEALGNQLVFHAQTLCREPTAGRGVSLLGPFPWTAGVRLWVQLPPEALSDGLALSRFICSSPKHHRRRTATGLS